MKNEMISIIQTNQDKYSKTESKYVLARYNAKKSNLILNILMLVTNKKKGSMEII